MSFIRGIVSTVVPYNLWQSFEKEESPNKMSSPSSSVSEASNTPETSNVVKNVDRENYQGEDVMSELALLREREKHHKMQLASLQDKLEWATKNARNGRKKASTDRERGKKPSNLDGQDYVNYVMYMPMFMKIYDLDKILPRGWNEFSTDPRSLCSRMMSKVTVPYGYTPKEYWENMMAAQITYKVRNEKCNYLKAVRREVCSEYSVRYELCGEVADPVMNLRLFLLMKLRSSEDEGQHLAD